MVGVTFKNMNSTDALKGWVERKLAALSRRLPKNTKIHVVFSRGSRTERVEITAHLPHKDIIARASHADILTAIEAAVAKFDVQLTRLLDRHKGHQRQHDWYSRASKRAGRDIHTEIPHERKSRLR